MGRGLNKVMIIGRLERAPEMRFTPGGRPVTSFSVATTHNWVSSEGIPREETEWFNVVAWGELAQMCHDRLDRNKWVYVEGRLKTRSWEDSSGKPHFRTEIVARELIVIDDETDYPAENVYDKDEDYNF